LSFPSGTSSASFVLAFAALTGCGFSADFSGTAYRCGVDDRCPGGYSCESGVCISDPTAPDGGGTVWLSDSAADFAGGSATSAVVADRGAIEPFAYHTGGVLERASAQALGTSSKTWDDVVALDPTDRAAIARNSSLSFGSGTPPGVDLPSSDGWTLRFEGEVWLEAGDWTFDLACDDHGFLDVADASGTFARVASSDLGHDQGTVHAGTAGWYGIRWVTSDDGGNASVSLQFTGPGFASFTSIPHNLLRTRADGLAGLVWYAFDGRRFDGNRAITIDDVAPAYYDWQGGAPDDLGISGVDDFSARWAGQLRIEIGGTYYLRYVSDDGQRLWIDGALMNDHWDDNAHEDVSPPLDLAPGWHDVVIDHSEHVGGAKAQLTVDSGPDLAGAPLPVDRLRPVEGRADRHEHAANHNRITIPDAPSGTIDGIAESSASFAAAAGAVAHGVEIGLYYEHEWRGDLNILLIAPSGRTSVLRSSTPNDGAQGSIYEHFEVSDLDGEPLNGTWTVRFVDTDPGAVGFIDDLELTVHTQGSGAPPIGAEASYESPVHDLGGTATIGAVRGDARAPSGSAIAIAVRTCASSGDCAAAAWVPVALGEVPAVAPGRFVQYQVALSSDGDVAPSLESIAIGYQR
jgi:subtilisin-like proprotein convertase family protein